jgi:Tfp pilus assembly protein PilO
VSVLKNRLTIILVIAIIGLLAAHYFLWMGYLRERQGQAALTDNITRTAATLAQTSQPPPDLEQQLAEAEAGLAAAQSDFPRDINSTRLINAILRLADDCQVRAIPLVTKPWTRENTGQGYDVFRLSVVVRGSFTQVTSFVSQLKDIGFASLVIENLSVTADGPSAGGTAPVIADLNLAIYAQAAE